MPAQARTKIAGLLREADYDALAEMYGQKRKVLRHLLAMTYDKDDLLGWRAMEAIGRIAAGMPRNEARDLVQKVLWMMREESGTNAWSAPEVLGEILRANPESLLDILPILVSFHEEPFFTAGVLWAMARIAELRADLIRPFSETALQHAGSDDPLVRGYSAIVLGRLNIPLPDAETAEETAIRYYDGDALLRCRVGEATNPD